MKSSSKTALKENEVIEPGKEKRHFFPWASMMTAYALQHRVLWILGVGFGLSVFLNFYLGSLAAKRQVWVFVKNDLGEVVQADPDTFLRGNYSRTPAEILGFSLRFVKDAFEFTPTNVNDNINFLMQFVETSAQGLVVDTLRFRERADLVGQGISVKVEDDKHRAGGQVPKATILRRQPLDVAVRFSRVATTKTGEVNILPVMGVQLTLREVPRIPSNPVGLVVTRMSEIDVGLFSNVTGDSK